MNGAAPTFAEPVRILDFATATPANHAMTVVDPLPSQAQMARACDAAFAAIESYAAKADYRGADNGRFAQRWNRFATPALWAFAALAGVATAVALGDGNASALGLIGGGVIGAGVRAAVPKIRRVLMAERSLDPGAVAGFQGHPEFESRLLGHIAKAALADMTERKVIGVEARSRLSEAAGKTGSGTAWSASAERLAKLVLLLPSGLERTTSVDDDRALAILAAYESLLGDERHVGRKLLRDKLLETPDAPRMTQGVWQTIYELSRAKPVAPASPPVGEPQ